MHISASVQKDQESNLNNRGPRSGDSKEKPEISSLKLYSLTFALITLWKQDELVG